jgi:hypothetical protein
VTHRLELPALLGSHPLGALASFGVLRKLEEWDPNARLAFSMEDDWVAVVHTSEVRDTDELVTRFSDWVGSDVFDRLLGWSDDVRISPAKYRSLIADALADDDRAMVDFLSAFAAVGAVDAQKSLVKPSAFYMVSGQQSFLRGMLDVLNQVRANAHQAFTEALIGPWQYRIQAHSLGWDPNTERLHALRHRAPTSEKPVCVGAAIVLAFWALPLFPALADGGRSATVGFTRVSGAQYLSWPVWSVPISLGELRSLLHAGEAAWFSRSRERMLRQGIEAVYCSRRAEFGQGYAILRAPEIVASSSRGA